MRTPTVARLMAELRLDKATAQTVRILMRRETFPQDAPAAFPRTCTWLRACYHRPHWTDVALHAIDELLRTHGVEGWPDPKDMRHGVSYCNTGDTYATTIALIHDGDGRRWYLGSWGDLAERGVCQ